MGNQQSDGVIGEPTGRPVKVTGEAWQRGKAVVKGKWGRLGQGGNWLGEKEAKGGQGKTPQNYGF